MPRSAAPRKPAPPAARETRVLFSATDRLYRTTTKVFQIVECRNCRLIRLHPATHSRSSCAITIPPDYWFVPEPPRPTAWSKPTAASSCATISASSNAPCGSPRNKASVLDVGCGGGLFLQMLAERGVRSPRRRPRFFARSRQRGLAPLRRSGRLRHALPRPLAARQLRRHHHVSRAGASLRSRQLSRSRAPAAQARRPPDRPGPQRRLLAVPAFRRALERHRRAAPSDRFPPLRSGLAARSLRIRSPAPQAFLPARQSRRHGHQPRARSRSHGSPPAPRRGNAAPAAVEGSAVPVAWPRLSLPFTLLEAACRAGSTIMVEARKKS